MTRLVVGVTIASILIPAGLLALPDRAAASNPASRAAVSKARARYLQVTHRPATHWHWNCKRPAGSSTWKCAVRAWRGSYVGNYDIRVRGKARIVGEGYVRAAVAGVVPLAKVFLKSSRDAKAACKAYEAFWQKTRRCEGWWGGTCLRLALTHPNDVLCAKRRPGDEDQFFFASTWDARHVGCRRRAHYFAGPNGTSAIRLRRSWTTRWSCRLSGVPV